LFYLLADIIVVNFSKNVAFNEIFNNSEFIEIELSHAIFKEVRDEAHLDK